MMGFSRPQTAAFWLMVGVIMIVPSLLYPVFLMKVMCFALFACAFNLLIGYMHPPMGIGLFILMAIARVEFLPLVKATIPFLAVLMVALALLTFVPQITLWLPNLLLPMPGR